LVICQQQTANVFDSDIQLVKASVESESAQVFEDEYVQTGVVFAPAVVG
jgi:hypothetical protein